MPILDSGDRKEFGTGAVRDISEGKGRCDLLPLDVVDDILNGYQIWSKEHNTSFYADNTTYTEAIIPGPTVLESVHQYMTKDNTNNLYEAVLRFIDDAFGHDPYGAMLELSKHYEEGSKKYSPNNWKLGIDLHCFIDSATRHYLKYLRGDDDEPHDRAVLWNLVGAIWTHKNLPEMNDI